MTATPGTPGSLDTRTATGTARAQRLRRATAGLTLALLLGSGLAACGDDKEEATDDQPTDQSTDQGGDENGGGDACASAIELNASMAMAPEDPAEMATWAEDTVLPLLETLSTELEGDAAEAAATLVDAAQAIADGGSPDDFFAPEAAEAQSTIGAEVHENCDVNAVDLTAIDYGYEGVPSEIEAGPTSFKLVNEGDEEHEMVLMRRADDATESLEELLALPEEEAMAKMQFTGVAFGGPGSTSYTALDLEAGTYFLVCFIPVGGGEDGPPHFTQGMSAEFTVA